MKRKVAKAKERSINRKVLRFLKPTKWTIVALAALYVSNYITFFGLIINYPVFYFYWNYALTPAQEIILAAARFAYLYLLSIIVVKILVR